MKNTICILLLFLFGCGGGGDDPVVTDNNSAGSVGTVVSAGQVWMDRNLGATGVATSMTDGAAYGDLYQWGRESDGHEKRTTVTTTTTLSGSDSVGHGDFITPDYPSDDWRSPQNDNLWQGVSGVNNPCPAGFRLPTEAEWQTEKATWSSNNAAGAFASPLKLTVSGYRDGSSGNIYYNGENGYYWSSTSSELMGSKASINISFRNDGAWVYESFRETGMSVRCIQN